MVALLNLITNNRLVQYVLLALLAWGIWQGKKIEIKNEVVKEIATETLQRQVEIRDDIQDAIENASGVAPNDDARREWLHDYIKRNSRGGGD